MTLDWQGVTLARPPWWHGVVSSPPRSMPSRPRHSRATPLQCASSETRTPSRPWASGGCSPSPPSSTSRRPPSSSATPPSQQAPPRGSTSSDGSLPSPRSSSVGMRHWPRPTSSSRPFSRRMA